jgi:PKD repeat protein
VAGFSGTPISGTAPLTVTFSDESTGVVNSWSWTFGDGGTSDEQNPTHEYAAAGVYTVSLTVEGPGGSDVLTRSNYITVTEPPPVAGFSGTPTSGPAPLTVTFSDESTGAVDSWLWDFGDGGSSTGQNPTYLYDVTGTYTVSLRVSGTGGSDVLTRSSYITVTEPTTQVVYLPFVCRQETGRGYLLQSQAMNLDPDLTPGGQGGKGWFDDGRRRLVAARDD